MVYTIVEADLHCDEDDIVQLWEHNFNLDFTQRYTWLYKNNPTPPVCLLLKTHSNETVGMVTFVPRQLIIRGKPVAAGHTVDFIVDRNHRIGGPAIKLQKELLARLRDRGIQCIYGIPLPAAYLIQRHVGYRIAGTYSRWVKPLKSRKWLGKHPRLGKYDSLISLFVDLGLYISSRSFMYRSQADLSIIEELPSTADIDALGEKMGLLFAISGRRSMNFLVWRFLHSPLKPYRYFTVTRPAANGYKLLLGIIVYYQLGQNIHISDVMFADESSIKILLHEFSRAQYKQAIESIELRFCGEPKHFIAALHKIGFFPRPENAPLVMLSNDRYIDAALLSNPSHWFLTEADFDV